MTRFTDLVEETIELARKTGASFADAYIAVSAKRSKSDCIATFNKKHFMKLGLNLLEVE